MKQHQVDVSDIEFAQALLDGGFGIEILVGIEFGRHEDLLTRHTRFTDTLSHFLLVVIHVCRIYLAETGGKRSLYGIDTDITVQAVSSQPENRHIVAAA